MAPKGTISLIMRVTLLVLAPSAVACKKKGAGGDTPGGIAMIPPPAQRDARLRADAVTYSLIRGKVVSQTGTTLIVRVDSSCTSCATPKAMDIRFTLDSGVMKQQELPSGSNVLLSYDRQRDRLIAVQSLDSPSEQREGWMTAAADSARQTRTPDGEKPARAPRPARARKPR
jgi:hypothetical protein